MPFGPSTAPGMVRTFAGSKPCCRMCSRAGMDAQRGHAVVLRHGASRCWASRTARWGPGLPLGARDRRSVRGAARVPPRQRARCGSAPSYVATARVLAWYALRYGRPIWPDEFVNRISGIKDALEAALEPLKDDIAEVRVGIERRGLGWSLHLAGDAGHRRVEFREPELPRVSLPLCLRSLCQLAQQPLRLTSTTGCAAGRGWRTSCHSAPSSSTR